MGEYIKREALITKFKKMELGEHGLVERLFADGVYAVIAAFPAADVAPVVHGRWERSENESNDEAFSLTDEEAWYYWKCSVCHEDICYHDAPMGRSFLPKYCPNCGAKMDGGDAR